MKSRNPKSMPRTLYRMLVGSLQYSDAICMAAHKLFDEVSKMVMEQPGIKELVNDNEGNYPNFNIYVVVAVLYVMWSDYKDTIINMHDEQENNKEE